MERLDCIVAGAGVVGLAIARALAQRGLEVLILEAADAIGTETSSRNSEVIHAGIYYEPGSLKAELCVEGKAQLYAYAAARGVPHKHCGKLIVATDAAQVPVLEAIRLRAARCGVGDLIMMCGAEARAMEPSLQCTAALLSPSTGIIDSHALMLALLGDAEGAGAMLSLNTKILSGRIEQDRFVLQTRDRQTGEHYEIEAACFVNAAGLGANAIAASLQGFPASLVPPLFMARGCYFAAAGKPAFSRLIYPVPEPGGLGVHLTLDLAGNMRFGPDVEWIDRKDYTVDPARADRFYAEIRRYWPALPDHSLSPTYSGIRPKLSGPGASAADFVIQGPAEHGQAGLVNLFGIESPGLTSSLAIAERVAAALLDRDSEVHVAKENAVEFYAHSVEGADKAAWERLPDHLERVGARARVLGDAIGIGALAEIAGRTHDLGKFDPDFQRRIDGAEIRVDHSTAGARAILDAAKTPEETLVAQLLAQARVGRNSMSMVATL